MKIRFLLLVLITLISTNFVNAEITGDVFRGIQMDNGSIIETNFKGLTLEYFLTDGQTINIHVDDPGNYKVSFSNIYCWRGCNVYPTIGVDRIEARENSNLISYLNDPISNQISDNLMDYKLTNVIFSELESNNSEVPKSNLDINNSNIPLPDSIKINQSEYYLIYWTGFIYSEENKTYLFNLNVSGGAKIQIDGNLTLDNLNGNGSNEFLWNLEEGVHNLTLVYYYPINEKPNLLWNKEGNLEIINKDYLMFKEGGSKKVSKLVRTMSQKFGPYYTDIPGYSYTLKYD
ncbi:MAG: hypothetical protein AABW56_01490, partial [Nanoarchaeota archaeon]